jgi:hypothetical protein
MAYHGPTPDDRFLPSEDVVAREIMGEFILIPITSGIGDMEDEIYTLNETGRAIWSKLDGKKRLKEVAADLRDEFDDPSGEIDQDVLGIVAELAKRNMVVRA